MSLVVRPITAEQHLEYVASRPSVSFLQVPSWAGVKAEWQARSIGWFPVDSPADSGLAPLGAGLVLMRQVPRLPRYLAYLPEGPDIDWLSSRMPRYSVSDWLDPMLSYLRQAGAFAVKMGPAVPVRRWQAETLKAAVTDSAQLRLRDVPADWTDGCATALGVQLSNLGWTQRPDAGAGFGDVQPRYVFQIPLAGRAREDLLAGFNQLWRRNIKKAERAGVLIETGDLPGLAEFHPVYVETAKRDGFTPRGLPYFERMWTAMRSEDPERIALYLARHDNQVLAATTRVRVGDHAWYSYGASADRGRGFRPSNAIQWRMICDSLDEGCSVYDMRGISDSLDEQDPLFGLLRFKLGTGGYAQEYLGEWDYALRPAMSRAFDAYLRRRGA